MRTIALRKVAKIDRTPANESETGSLPYVGLEHIEKEVGRLASDYERQPANLKATKFKFTSDHVLYGKLRPYLNKVILPDFEGVCTTELLPILPDKAKLDRTYLWAYLLSPSFVGWASQRVSGANLPRLSPRDLSNHAIPCPPLAEQKRIAVALISADRLRRLRRYALELSDGFLQSVFLEMFGDPVINPMGWPKVKLGELLSFLTSGSRGWAKYYSSNGALFIRIQNVGSNRLLLDDIAFVDPPDNAESRRTRVQSGDILLSITADLGRTAVIPDGFPKAHINQHLALIRLKEMNPLYVAAYINSPGGNFELTRLDREGVKSGLNFDDIRGFEIFYVPEELQDKFQRIFYQSKRKRNQLLEAIRQSDHLFDTLLHRAFRGEL